MSLAQIGALGETVFRRHASGYVLGGEWAGTPKCIQIHGVLDRGLRMLVPVGITAFAPGQAVRELMPHSIITSRARLS